MYDVSIIVPVYNVEKYLTKCLDSLINQTFNNYEIIIINDGSTDNSESIALDYQKNNLDIIKYFKKENGGLSDARNFGLEKATGKYIMFIDSDDYITDNMVEKLYKKIIEENSDMAICNFIRVNHKGQEIRNYNYNPGTVNLIDEKKIMLNQPSACNKMFKKELFDNIKFDKNVYYEDLRLITKLYLKSKISFIDDFCYYYIERKNSIIHDSNSTKNYQIVDAIDSIIDFYKSQNYYQEFKEEIEFLMIDNIIISTFVRIICSNKNYMKELKKYWKFIKINFPQFKRNKYIKELNIKRKLIYLLNINHLYLITKIIYKMKG